MISRVAMGAMSLSKIADEETAALLVRSAYTQGINFFDTSRSTPECERLLGNAIGDIRSNVMVATKTAAQSGAEVLGDVETSLNVMHTDKIDLYQYESDGFVPQENGPDGIYNVLKNLKETGKISAIGFATQDLDAAENAVRSGLYDTLQFPFSSFLHLIDLLFTVKFCLTYNVLCFGVRFIQNRLGLQLCAVQTGTACHLHDDDADYDANNTGKNG